MARWQLQRTRSTRNARTTRAYDIKNGPPPQITNKQRRKESITSAMNTMDRSIYNLDVLTQEIDEVLQSLKSELQLASTMSSTSRDDESMLIMANLKHESINRASELCGMLSECALRTQTRLNQSQLFVPRLFPRSSKPTKKTVKIAALSTHIV